MIVISFIGTFLLWRIIYTLATNEYSKNELPRALQSFSLPALYSGFYLLRLKHVLFTPLSKKILSLLWALTLLHTIICITYACVYFSPILNYELVYDTLQTIAAFLCLSNYDNDTAPNLASRLIALYTLGVFCLQCSFLLIHWKIFYRLKLRPQKNKKSRKWTK